MVRTHRPNARNVIFNDRDDSWRQQLAPSLERDTAFALVSHIKGRIGTPF